MDKKGFTLVEVLVVIVLLGMIIGLAVPGVMRANRKAREKTLAAKVKNIEKAAVLYGQDNKEKFETDNSSYQKTTKKYCFKEDTQITKCYYYNNYITVNELIEDGYIKGDNNTNNIENPVYKDNNLNNCKIQIYKKYDKIYAVYLKESVSADDKCWK